MNASEVQQELPRRRTTFSKFIIEEAARNGVGDARLTSLLNDVQTACKFISRAVSRGSLDPAGGTNIDVNVQGELQKPLDVIANDIMLHECADGGTLCGMASEELPEPYAIPSGFKRGPYLLAFDPLDGSSNLDVNVTVGTIFSVLQPTDDVSEAGAAAFFSPAPIKSRPALLCTGRVR